ncbi:MAG: AI-2E family transporter [Victivallaceae bacterium]|nr:AI-2E family transporter [Victivallaceae bacterium]
MKAYWQRQQTWFKSLFNQPAGKAFASIANLLHSQSADDAVSNAVISLLKAVLWADGPADEREVEYFEKILEPNYTQVQIAQLTAELKSPRKINIETACGLLRQFDDDRKQQLLQSLISLGLANDNYSAGQRKIVAAVAACLGVSEETLQKIEIETEQTCKTQNRLIKSGAGIIVALIVIGVFILTATLLKSVLFGLILGYVFLPMEKFYERKLEGRGVFSKLFKFFTCFGKPFKVVSRSMRRGKAEPDYTEEEIARRKRQTLIAKASTLTVGSFMLIMAVIIMVIFSVSANYLAGMSLSVRHWLNRHVKTEQLDVSAPPAANEAVVASKDEKTAGSTARNTDQVSYVKKVLINLEDIKPRLKEVPVIRWCVEQTSKVLNDPDTQKELLAAALKKSGGIFSFATGIISSLVSFLLNTLLAIFFFSLFLSKMAEFIRDDKNQQKMQSEYLIRTVFNSKWLPAATEDTIAQAQNIISQVIDKLRIWLRGYLTLMSVDAVVYTTVFYLLGVPYALLLGLIAAFGLLLPYIGPIASAALTILVTLAAGQNVTMAQLLMIVGIYVIENGIVEQLFLYPAVIGESLGLTTLETIIVVLLGGIFAGITGMIFAIPTAAVLKYLIPQIYTCWK